MLKPITHTQKKRVHTLTMPRSFFKVIPYFLSFALIASPFVAPLTMPLKAYANEFPDGFNNYSISTYDYTFESLTAETALYYVSAQNIGDVTEYYLQSTVANAVIDGASFYVTEGASTSLFDNNEGSKVTGSAAHIALWGTGNGSGLTATANNNTSTIDGGYIYNLAGATISINGFLNNTYIKDSSTPVDYTLYCRMTTLDSITANNNSVIMTGGEVGYGLNKDETESTDGTFLAGVYVLAKNSNTDATFNLDSNSISIFGGTVGSNIDIAGAYLEIYSGTATMTNNSVLIENVSDGNIQAKGIYGAYLNNGYLSSILNNVLYSVAEDLGFTVAQGANVSAITATMYGNSVTIASSAGSFFQDAESSQIAGAYANVSNTATMYDNSVTITGGTFGSSTSVVAIYGAGVKGDSPLVTYSNESSGNEHVGFSSEGTVTLNLYNNTVTITGGTLYGTIAGAYAIGDSYTKQIIPSDDALQYNATISHNTVTIYGGTLCGIDSLRSDGYAKNESYYDGIYGGTYVGVATSGSPNNYTIGHEYSITNNTVSIGYDAIIEATLDTTTTTTYNLLNLAGGFAYVGTNVSSTARLTPDANAFDGNTLYINQLSNNKIEVATVANFENYVIDLGAANTTAALDTSNGGTALITAESLFLGNGYSDATTASTASNGTVATKYAELKLGTTLDNTIAVGDTITLFSVTGEEVTINYTTNTDGDSVAITQNFTIDGSFSNLDANNNGTITGVHGAFLAQTWDIVSTTDATSGTTITATLKGTQASEQSKVLGEASLSAMGALSITGDLVAGQGIRSAHASLNHKSSASDTNDSGDSGGNATQSAPFMVTSMGISRYETGSHVDVNSIGIVGGLAYGGEARNGNWLLGGFFEFTDGDYSTYNSFSNADSVKGDGDMEAYGLGMLARYDFDFPSQLKPYVEASLRFGRVENQFYTSDMHVVGSYTYNEALVYETSHLYYGAHIAFGNVYDVSEKLSLDTSLSYFWTQQASKTENLFGHNVEYDAVNSHRVRLNGRASYALQESPADLNVNVYGGLGFEYEFDGDAVTYVDGYKAPVPSLSGGTGIGEVGVILRRGANSPFAVDLGLQGYVGLREGVSGTMQFMYSY